MKKLVSFAGCVLAISLFGGCLSFYTSKKIVGEDEERAKILFENEVAANLLYASLKKQSPTIVKSTQLGVPFVTFYSSSKVLSETMMYNKAVEACDLNGDKTITEKEATQYYSRQTNTPVDLIKVMDKANISVSQ